MKDLLREIQSLYYQNGLSAKIVGDRLGLTVWQVIRIMRKNKLPRRSQAETHHLAYLAQPLSFSVKCNLTKQEGELKTIGLMLYWAEGSKANDHTVDFTNSDFRMVILFLKTLRQIYGINEKRLRVQLYCYANQDVSKLIDSWSLITKIPTGQFIKPYVRQDFKIEKINKMPLGVAHIRYNDKKLLALIKSDIENLLIKLECRSGRVVKCT